MHIILVKPNNKRVELAPDDRRSVQLQSVRQTINDVSIIDRFVR